MLAELGGAIKGALSKLNNATVIDEEGACALRGTGCLVSSVCPAVLCVLALLTPWPLASPLAAQRWTRS